VRQRRISKKEMTKNGCSVLTGIQCTFGGGIKIPVKEKTVPYDVESYPYMRDRKRN
jgi:hypothetical protein